ncbi:hypothetical protein KSP40_PGU012235 [Platanthera guangdongensis]|uniref:Uncharacterized protein n=1 Tax=Platanthera guangdongensis TaxID=2320717 RepID=A0ABR2LUY6_9ASPA
MASMAAISVRPGSHCISDRPAAKRTVPEESRATIPTPAWREGRRAPLMLILSQPGGGGHHRIEDGREGRGAIVFGNIDGGCMHEIVAVVIILWTCIEGAHAIRRVEEFAWGESFMVGQQQ